MNHPIKITLAVAMVALAGSNPSSCLAQNGTWNVDADGIWSTATNWVGGIIANGANNTADFSATPITTNRTVVLDTSRTLGSINIGEPVISYYYQNFVSSNNSVLTLSNSTGMPLLLSAGYRNLYIPIAGNGGLNITNLVSTALGSELGIFASNTYLGTTLVSTNVRIYPRTTTSFGATTPADGTTVAVGGCIYLVGDGGVYPGAESLNLSGGGYHGDFLGALRSSGDLQRTWTGDIISSQADQAAIGVDTGGTLILNGTLTGGNSAYTVKVGGGTLILAGNVPALSPWVNEGTLQIGNGGTTGNLANNAYFVNYATLAFNRSDTYNWSPTTYVGGNGTIFQKGSGKLVMNTYIPFNDPPSQSLLVGPGSTLETMNFVPVGMVTLDGGTLSSSGGNYYAQQSWALKGGVTVLSNSLTSVIMSHGTDSEIQLLDGTTAATFNVARGATNGIDLLVSGVLTHSYYNYGNFGTLIKAGAGTMVLSGDNQYQNGTTVSAGSLFVNNTTGSGTGTGGVTVQDGATLGGNGTISGSVTIQPGGTLTPGMPIGALTIGGNLTLQGTTILEINKSTPATNDLLVVAGAMSLGGNLVVTNAGPDLAVGDRFVLLSQVGFGSFDNVTLAPLHGGLGWVNNLASDGSVSVYQAVNPTPTTVTAQFVSGNLDLSWPADHIGWQLEVQINPLNVGLSSNWTVVAGSTSVNSMSLPVSLGNPTVFYRLALP
jgi:autotransporter-associated beta strand protein